MQNNKLSIPFDIYSFPPLYTRQPNKLTRNKQIETWSQIIVATAQSIAAWEMDQTGRFKPNYKTPSSLKHSSSSSLSIFNNEEIHRSVPQTFIDEILTEMLKKNQIIVKNDPKHRIKVVGSTTSNKKEEQPLLLEFFILWKSLDAWGSLLLEWFETSTKLNQIVTLYELSAGDETLDWEFHGMPYGLLVECLTVLVRRGRATLIKNDDNGNGNDINDINDDINDWENGKYVAVKVI